MSRSWKNFLHFEDQKIMNLSPANTIIKKYSSTSLSNLYLQKKNHQPISVMQKSNSSCVSVSKISTVNAYEVRDRLKKQSASIIKNAEIFRLLPYELNDNNPKSKNQGKRARLKLFVNCLSCLYR